MLIVGTAVLTVPNGAQLTQEEPMSSEYGSRHRALEWGLSTAPALLVKPQDMGSFHLRLEIARR